MIKHLKLWLIFGTVLIIIFIGALLYYGIIQSKHKKAIFVPVSDINNFLGYFHSSSKLGIYTESAVSTDSALCAPIGKKILEKNGTAVDAIIAVLLCMGVTIPQSMGLGGGCLINIYHGDTKKSYVIDAREAAPSEVTEDMYKSNPLSSQLGPHAIGVPGELSGYWEMHKKFGKLPWKELFTDAIGMSEDGFAVAESLAYALKLNEKLIKKHHAMREVFINNNTGEIYKKNEIIYRKTYAETLKMLANADDAYEMFYNGEIAKLIIDDITDEIMNKNWDINATTPIIKLEDFNKYKANTDRMPIVANLNRGNLTIYSMPLPGSGILLTFMLRVMEKYNDLYPDASKSLNKSVLYYHRLIETFKYAFSKRSLLGDDKYENDIQNVISDLTSEEFINRIFEKINDTATYDITHYNVSDHFRSDHGTAHVSVLDKYGNAAAVSTTINFYFGSKVMSKRTGIILNNQMDDFSTGHVNLYGVPPSYHNHVKGGKRPLSSMSPSIFVDDTGIRLIIGASGGTKITTAIAAVAIRYLWFDETIKEAIDGPRLHHQLNPNEIVYDKHFPVNVLDGLKKFGHKLKKQNSYRSSIVMAVGRDRNGKIYANSDYRKGGDVSGV